MMFNMKIVNIVFILLIPFILNAQVEEPGLSTPIKEVSSKDTLNLQELVDRALPGDTIKLKEAIYKGEITIRMSSIVIDGQNHATIDGGGHGSVIKIRANSVYLKNMIIQNSGGLHDHVDAGVSIADSSQNNIIENCRIRECLFGIDVMQSFNNKIIHCEISSLMRRESALKGDAIRFWYSMNNTVQYNYWHHVRDMVVWYSAENLFQFNRSVGNRYAIHFMYSHNNRIQNNYFKGNSVGVFLMYSQKTIMTGNTIANCKGPSGMCLGMKETSSNQILNNTFIYSAEGIHFDVSPYVLTETNTIQDNEIAFCNIGMKFHNKQEGNLIRYNYFHNNLIQVFCEAGTANLNTWEYNYWDDYEGFDRDGDNIGDNPFVLFSYTEHIWNFDENLKFFYGAPILSVLDFLEKLAPFSKPKLVLVDKKPIYNWRIEKKKKKASLDE